ncbi:MFS transporter [Clostridium bowmanii]|uniref:MFS transporter n=1 Tax=Clostridium bowmanii TaxID=132925 RepID=UPI001C0CF8C2|nr:MFS transporter [Clostridium bowmanii]MBU3189646.1 MFS transporter [Clostridium bowmanii]MCA1073508.1 MFS transporter [Clostridium bowmanii]
MKEKLPLSKQIAYSLGQFGWSLLSGIVGSYLIFYYIPTKESGIMTVIPQVVFLGFLTVIGLITMLGRFFDAVTDPWIATLSDRSKSKKGRRISFMQKAAIPFAVCTVLMFWSPVKGESPINAIFLTVVLLLFYLFLTMYVTPFFALLSELGHTPEERLNLSTFISVTWFLGAAVASQAPQLWNIFLKMGYSMETSMRLALSILAFIGLIFLLVPVFTIDEKRYCESVPSELKMIDSIKATFRNREFTVFVFSDLVYWIAITTFQASLLYYVTVLLRLPDTMFGTLFILLGVGSFLFYVPINIIAKKFGKKKLLVVAFCMFIAVYIYGAFLGKLPISNQIQAYLLVVLAAIPMAIFGILPNVVIADIAEYDARKTGIRREGMFFGTRTFMSKVGQTLSMLILSALLLLKRNGSNEIGIRLTGVFAAGFCVVGLVLLLMYNEEKILSGITSEVKAYDLNNKNM